MASTIQLRVDDDLKNKSDELFKALGTDTTTVIRMFLTQAIAENGFPFAIKKVDSNPFRALSESELLDKLAKSRENAEHGLFQEASSVSEELRSKYGI